MKCAQGDTQALKLWLSYRFGLPKQQIDVTTNGEKIAPPIQWIGRSVAIEAAKVLQDDDEPQADDLQALDLQDPQALTLQAVEKIALNNQDLK